MKDRLRFATLADTPLEMIKNTFQEAFSDYEIPVNLTIDSLRTMMVGRDIQLNRSVGCFDGDALVGFILCGCRESAEGPILYDGGTGVLPSHRGEGIATRMLTWLLEREEPVGTGSFILEVLEHNTKAIELYGKAGFVTSRFLRCFKIDKSSIPLSLSCPCDISPMTRSSYEVLDHLRYLSHVPAWQNAVPSVLNNWDNYIALEVEDSDGIVGFGMVHKTTGDIPQLAVGRDGEYFDCLVDALARSTGSLSLGLINVEDGSLLSNLLVQKGWKNVINQYEMVYRYTSSKA